jgi:hypothetical protein
MTDTVQAHIPPGKDFLVNFGNHPAAVIMNTDSGAGSFGVIQEHVTGFDKQRVGFFIF